MRSNRLRPSLAAAGDNGDPLLPWIALSALGSALLLATTNAITQWSAVVPFLWIVPLSLYLLTFVIAFGQQRLYRRLPFVAAFLLLAGTTFLPAPPESTPEFLSQLALQAATLFAGCMICHGEIVRLQPAPARLPKFYLAIAAGGALGGALVTLVAPLAFSDYFEHPLVLCLIAALAVTLVLRQTGAHRVRWLAPVAASLAALYFLGGLGVGVWRELVPERALVERVRNFYGVVKVLREVDEDTRQSSLVMQQAGVDQGAQYQSPERRMEPACGFDKASALGLAVAHNARRRAGGPTAPVRIGVVGLGAGMIAAHGRAGDVMRYYELNPAVLDLVDRRFTFLKEGKARTDVLLGDGRLVLERQLRAGEAQGFDILVLNAFRGASPPMHLMTKEAFDIYLAHLATDGILAVNFEFEMFEMAPLHRGMARRFGMDVRWFDPKGGDGCEGAISWALYTRDKAFFEAPPVKAAASRWRDRGSRPDLVWTDSDSNLMSIINWRDVAWTRLRGNEVRRWRDFASPCVEGIAFDTTRGEGDASASWIGHCQRCTRALADPSRWTHRVGVTGRARDRHPHLGTPSDLARRSAVASSVVVGELSPWRSVLPLLQRRPAFAAGGGKTAGRAAPLRYALGAGCVGGECRIGFHSTAWAREDFAWPRPSRCLQTRSRKRARRSSSVIPAASRLS